MKKVIMGVALLFATAASAQLVGPPTPLGQCKGNWNGGSGGTLCCTGAGALDDGYITCSGDAASQSGGCCAADNGANTTDTQNPGNNDACGHIHGAGEQCTP